MNLFQFVVQDWKANAGNPKGRCFMVLFRLANFCNQKRIYFYIGLPYLALYKVVVQWLFTLEIPYTACIGPGLAIYHGQAIILNKGVKIGRRCTLRHCTTIGIKTYADHTHSKAPEIGDFVDIGSNVCIIGDITIGDHTAIGSGAVVVKSFNADAILVGNPARDISAGAIN